MWIIENIKKIDKKILHIGSVGLKISLLISLISIMILSFYHCTNVLYQYEIGMFLLRIGLLFSCFLVICVFAFDRINKDLY